MKILVDNGHGSETFGKCSPDKRLLEYKWAREIADRVVRELKSLKYDTQLLTPETYDVSITKRVLRANEVCKKYGAKNVLLVSIHNNAAGNGLWSQASGFSVFVSKNSSANSKKCARIFTEEAVARNLMGNRAIPSEKYWTWSWTTDDIGILSKSNCPAVLTENLFMDNKQDCDFLLSEAGKRAIVDLHVSAITKYIKSL